MERGIIIVSISWSCDWDLTEMWEVNRCLLGIEVGCLGIATSTRGSESCSSADRELSQGEKLRKIAFFRGSAKMKMKKWCTPKNEK